MKDEQIIIRIDAELKEKIRYIAKAKGVSYSDLIRGLIADEVGAEWDNKQQFLYEKNAWGFRG